MVKNGIQGAAISDLGPGLDDDFALQHDPSRSDGHL
jgi:hypothetical protein